MASDTDPWETPAKRTVFFISPIGEEGSDVRKQADQTLKHLVRKALPEGKYKVERADEDKHPGAITPRILSKIIEADLVLADLSGLNPNVFYELAVAHGHHKPVVHMQKSDERPAFDVKDMRIVRYQLTDPDKLEVAVTELQAQTEAALASPSVIETPLTATGKFQALDQSADPQAEVAERLEALERLLRDQGAPNRSPVSDSSDTFAIARWVEARLSDDSLISGQSTIRELKTGDTSAWFDSWVDTLIDRFGERAKPSPPAADDPWATPAPAVQTTSDPWAAPAKKEDEPPF